MLKYTLLTVLCCSAQAQVPAVNSPMADIGYSYQAPTTGFAITIANSVGHVIVDPLATLATGTITMPAAPVDGQTVAVVFSQIITALTMSANGGQSIKGGLASAAVGTRVECIYRLSTTTWYC